MLPKLQRHTALVAAQRCQGGAVAWFAATCAFLCFGIRIAKADIATDYNFIIPACTRQLEIAAIEVPFSAPSVQVRLKVAGYLAEGLPAPIATVVSVLPKPGAIDPAEAIISVQVTGLRNWHYGALYAGLTVTRHGVTERRPLTLLGHVDACPIVREDNRKFPSSAR